MQSFVDLRNIRCLAENLAKSWFNGPFWLIKQGKWPEDITTDPFLESENQRK